MSNVNGIAAGSATRGHTVLAEAEGSAYQSLRQRPVTRAERYALGKSLRARCNGPVHRSLSLLAAAHLGFGGGGVHFCLGAQVARTQLRAIFRELLSRLPDVEAGEQDLLEGCFAHAVRSMPCTFTA